VAHDMLIDTDHPHVVEAGRVVDQQPPALGQDRAVHTPCRLRSLAARERVTTAATLARYAGSSSSSGSGAPAVGCRTVYVSPGVGETYTPVLATRGTQRMRTPRYVFTPPCEPMWRIMRP